MGLVAPRLASGALLAVLVLAFGAVDAHAVDYNFTVSPETPNQGQPATFELTPSGATFERVRWDLDGDGEFDDGDTATVTHTYADPGPVTVRMRVREAKGVQEDTVTKTIKVNGRPEADFSFTPSEPMAGESVAFTPSVADAEGDDVTLQWDFGDGEQSSEGAPTHAFATAGDYDVVLTATDQRGAVTRVTHAVTVAERPAPPDPGPGDPGPVDPGPAAPSQPDPGAAAPVTTLTPAPKPKPSPPKRMRPFPVVRIAGVVLPHGALVRILAVRAPRGARVLARCRGKGCPAGAVARSSTRSVVRLRRFERRLPAGVRLELFVRKAGRIGKYTRFTIRAGQPPARIDRCLMPGRTRPVRCS